MKVIIFCLIYLTLNSSIVSANEYGKEKDVIFLEDNYQKNFKDSELIADKQNENNNYLFNQNSAQKCLDSTPSYPCKKCKIIMESPGQTAAGYFREENIVSILQREPPDSKNTLNIFCDCFFDSRELQERFEALSKNGQENSLEGLLSQADIAMTKKHYYSAENFYKKALSIEGKDQTIKNKLAYCHRRQKKYALAEKLYKELLQQNPNSQETKLNYAYMEIEKKNYTKANTIFQKILDENHDYKPAKMGLIYSYISNEQYFQALQILNAMPENEEVNTTKSYIYYTLGMYSDANKPIKNYINEDTVDLANQIKRQRAFTFTPSYIFLNQELSEIFDLDVRKIGLHVSEYGANNIKGFIDYGMYIYMSGNYNDNHLEDVTNEIKGGIEGRPVEKFAFRSDIGIKVFQTQDAMIITDSWLKYYMNDNIKFKLGFYRNNLEQSYLAAVGVPIHGVFTGQVAANKAYLEVEGRLPKQAYYVLKFNGGAMTAQNLPTNAFIDTFAIIGKTFYDNHENLWIQHASVELMTNNISYQTDLLVIPGADPPKKVFGGYFSPSFYNAETVNLRVEGANKKLHLRYGIKGFLGYQNIFSPDSSNVVYGIYPYLAYNLNDYISTSLSYIYSNYATVLRHFFMISVDIKLYKKAQIPKKKTEAHIIKS